MCKQITMRWLFCNKVEMCWWKSDRCKKISEKVNIHMRDIEMSGKMKRLKRKMEVQKITFNYLHGPSLGIETFYAMMMMAIQKIFLSGFKICCGCMGWPGWVWDFPAWNFVPVRPCTSLKWTVTKVPFRQVMSLGCHLWNTSRASKCSSYLFEWGIITLSKTVRKAYD